IHVLGALRLCLKLNVSVEKERHVAGGYPLHDVVCVDATNRVRVQLPSATASVFILPLPTVKPVPVRGPVPVAVVTLYPHSESLCYARLPYRAVFPGVAGFYSRRRCWAFNLECVFLCWRGWPSPFSWPILFWILPPFRFRPFCPRGGQPLPCS